MERPGSLNQLDYRLLQQCMHCGLCLPSCPTYVNTGRERHSPRGRIALMRAVADGELALSRSFAGEMSFCLGCLACTSACPAGVDYGRLLETARAQVEAEGVLDRPSRRLLRATVLRVLFTRPRLLRTTGRLLWCWQASGLQRLARAWRLTRLLPAALRRLEPATPRVRARFSDALIAPCERPRGPVRFRVVLLTGCAQDLLFSDVNRATADVLLENGCEVITPRRQPCCGSLHAHNGDLDTARALARRHLELIDPFAFDAIISNAGGCGSHLRHYTELLAGEAGLALRATEWSRKIRDVHEWLVEIGFRPPRAPDGVNAPSVAITYQESCHLSHAQKVSRQPRDVLRSLPGIELRECEGASMCCGSAGIYSLTQPEMATQLQRQKIAQIRATGAAIVASANPGCHLHIENGLCAEAAAPALRVVHPVVLLAEAYAAERRARS